MIGRERGGDVRRSADQNFIARGKIESRDREMKRNRAIANRDPIFAAAICRERFFEPGNRFTKRARNFAAAQGRNDDRDFFLTSTLILSLAVPRNGPCLTLMA